MTYQSRERVGSPLCELTESGAHSGQLHSGDDSINIDRLDAAEQERLVLILDQYLIDLEEGRQVDPQDLIARHPEFAIPLRHYLDGLQLLHEWNQNPLAAVSFSRGRRAGESAVAFELPGAARLGPYVLGPSLGRGAMGIVYRAYDEQHHRPVAVKVLSHGAALDPNHIDRFRREAKTAALLDHPHVVPVYAVGCDRGINYYAMQLVEGASFDRRLQAARKLDNTLVDVARATDRDVLLAGPLLGPDRYRRIAQWGASAANALHAAHLAGVIHRDIKPSNLLLGNDGQLWVTDFGLARVQAEHALTKTGDLVGTVRYMSPEQAEGRGEMIDARTDVYCLGVTLYELATRVPAFEGGDMLDLLRKIQIATPIPPRAHDARLPVDLEIIILRAMRPRAIDRYPTAEDLAEDLQRFAAGQSIRACSVTWVERIAGWARNHRSLAASLLALWVIIFVLCVATTTLVMWAQARADQLRERSDANYRKARETVDVLGFDFTERLASIPGAEHVRQELLAKTIGYYEQFIASSKDDPLLRHDVARTRLAVARLTSLTGSYAEADAAYGEVVAALLGDHGIESSLMDAFASQLDGFTMNATSDWLLLVRALNEWAVLASEHGDQLRARRRLDYALQCFQQSTQQSLQRGLPQLPLAVDDDAVEIRLAKVLTHNNRSVVALNQAMADESAHELQQAIELLQPLPRRSLLTSQLGNELADAFLNLSALLGSKQQYESAAQAAEQSLALRRQTQPTRVAEYQSRMAITYNNLAAVRCRDGKTEDALAAYQRSVELLEDAMRRAPGRMEPRGQLAVTLNNLGMACVTLGRPTAAEQAFTQAEALAQQVLAADPSNQQSTYRLASIRNNQAVHLRALHRIAESEERLRSAAELIAEFDNHSTPAPSEQSIVKQIELNLESVKPKR